MGPFPSRPILGSIRGEGTPPQTQAIIWERTERPPSWVTSHGRPRKETNRRRRCCCCRRRQGHRLLSLLPHPYVPPPPPLATITSTLLQTLPPLHTIVPPLPRLPSAPPLLQPPPFPYTAATTTSATLSHRCWCPDPRTPSPDSPSPTRTSPSPSMDALFAQVAIWQSWIAHRCVSK